jgi:putative nucleotidyltransferase with HDIG domain
MQNLIGNILYNLIKINNFDALTIKFIEELNKIFGKCQISIFIKDTNTKTYKYKTLEIPENFGRLSSINKVIYDQFMGSHTLYSPFGSIGILRVSRENPFIKKEIDLFKSIIEKILPIFETSFVQTIYKNSLENLVQVLSNAIDARDFVTSGHSKRVWLYAKEISKFLSINKNDMVLLKYSCLLHDIGKIGVPESVLFKHGPLSSEEYMIVKRHSGVGQSLLSKIQFPDNLSDIPKIVGAHHEKLDGSGYPAGLSENEIPEIAKLITVCDIFDALTSKRQYREELTFESSFLILEQEIGKIDSKYVEALKQLPKKLLSEIHSRYRI